MKQITLRLPDELHAQLKGLAEREHRSLHAQVLHILQAAPDIRPSDRTGLPRAERESAAGDGTYRGRLVKVARMLCEAGSDGVDVDAIAEASGLSREAILERIDHLKTSEHVTEGALIEVSEGRYRSDIPLTQLAGDIKSARWQWWEDRPAQ